MEFKNLVTCDRITGIPYERVFPEELTVPQLHMNFLYVIELVRSLPLDTNFQILKGRDLQN